MYGLYLKCLDSLQAVYTGQRQDLTFHGINYWAVLVYRRVKHSPGNTTWTYVTDDCRNQLLALNYPVKAITTNFYYQAIPERTPIYIVSFGRKLNSVIAASVMSQSVLFTFLYVLGGETFQSVRLLHLSYSRTYSNPRGVVNHQINLEIELHWNQSSVCYNRNRLSSTAV